MLILLMAGAAMAPQAAVLPPPRIEFDDSVTFMQGSGATPPRPRRPAPHWQPREVAPAPAAEPAPTNAVDAGLRPGDILIDTARHRLMFAAPSGRVESFPVAVGKQGASWKGTAVVGRKVAFPTWRPTAHMRSKERLPSVVAPGRHNPLGTRALYLYRNGRDTLFRIHGTNAPWSIGKSVSHGCIRMLNASVEHLYDEVRLGARVTVR